jgi:hypothetical protein
MSVSEKPDNSRIKTTRKPCQKVFTLPAWKPQHRQHPLVEERQGQEKLLGGQRIISWRRFFHAYSRNPGFCLFC